MHFHQTNIPGGPNYNVSVTVQHNMAVATGPGWSGLNQTTFQVKKHEYSIQLQSLPNSNVDASSIMNRILWIININSLVSEVFPQNPCTWSFQIFILISQCYIYGVCTATRRVRLGIFKTCPYPLVCSPMNFIIKSKPIKSHHGQLTKFIAVTKPQKLWWEFLTLKLTVA